VSGADPAPAARTDEEVLARFRASARQPKGSALLGFEMIAVSQADMRVEAHFTARSDFANPMRQIQGGYLCAMLDDVMSVACMVASGMTHVAPTLEMKTSFLRPAPADDSKLRGVGKVVKWGRTIAFTEGELWGADGKLIAKASGTAMPTPFKNYK
jgi:uncharacterized protein (TIGR00369 family)